MGRKAINSIYVQWSGHSEEDVSFMLKCQSPVRILYNVLKWAIRNQSVLLLTAPTPFYLEFVHLEVLLGKLFSYFHTVFHPRSGKSTLPTQESDEYV